MVGIEACLPPHLIAIVGKRSVDGDVLGQLKTHPMCVDSLQIFRSTSTSWRAQEPPRSDLLAGGGVDFGGRGEVT